MKWLGIIVLLVVGVLAALVAIEYFTVAIHLLPSFMGRHHGRGHYRKRGAGAALIALIAFVAAGYLIFRMRRADKAAVAIAAPASVAPATAEQLPTETSVVPEQPTGE